ncbi:alpha-amylase family glycosyl hydrolase [Massilia sp. Mn16-1_5]|uniref:alpha-amylase family glycosyl hydrolase n=1 Tax=Massilia sp. Mn16-1_5 TaxID=2079199 RepID=UPI00109E8D23|nr:alpha-amylase family glycosyl hydrolase [Massilia sp. Mn16-1_5]THC45739.1 alpha-amlyase [Massilia sp. Mn16-1_5]
MKLSALAVSLLFALNAAHAAPAPWAAPTKPFVWENATVYFLLTDRFNNGNPDNDHAYGRKDDAATLRGFMGGDFAGVTAKIKEGYFTELGVTALWITPPVEQIHAGTDEGTGKSYGFHGYWARDFTAIDANLGTEGELRTLVDTAHAHGLRVLFDVVMNHTGPVTGSDPVWPAEWVRTSPTCTYKDARTTIDCTLVKNLPDIRTGDNKPVALPPALVEKWKKEGRYEREVQELDAFFKRTGYPRAPRYYLMKWHADWVRKFGVDGFRADTVKHTEPGVWKELKKVASAAFEDWKKANPAKKLDNTPFYMTAEVYNYAIQHGRAFDLGGMKVDYPAQGFDSMINFAMKTDAVESYEKLFSTYSEALQGPMKGASVLNYLSSHDDGQPYDALRQRPYETANKLLLAPGAAQIYYGDETARLLQIEGAQGDATLRSFMNWDELAANTQRGLNRVRDVREHWARLGRFRQAHPAVGAGVHRMIQHYPYTFKRTYEKGDVTDRVVVALGLPTDKPTAVPVTGVFLDGQTVRDWYSGKTAIVKGGKVQFDARNPVVLIGQE